MDDEYDVINDDDRKDDENQDDVKPSDQSESKAVLWSTDWTVETILNQIKRGNIDMDPKFQRRDAWDQDRKSKFIESLILGYPIPQIVLAEKTVNKRTTYIVIDGKQRLLTLIQFCADELFSSEEGLSKKDKFDSIKLQNIETKDLIGLTYTDLINQPQLYEYRNAFDNQSIRNIIIKNCPNEEFLYRVFYRLNTGSLPLSPQELRQALHSGAFLDYVDDFTNGSSIVKSLYNTGDKSDRRMRDIELVIRFIAFKNYLTAYNGNLKEHLDFVCKNLNETWSDKNKTITTQLTELEKAIEFTLGLFDKYAFARSLKRRSMNKAVYDIMVYYFSEKTIRDCIMDNYDNNKTAIVNEFNRLCEEDNDFIESIQASTKDTVKIVERISKWGTALSYMLTISIDIPILVKSSDGSRSKIQIVKTKIKTKQTA